MGEAKWVVVEQTYQIDNSGKRNLVSEKQVRTDGVPEKLKSYIDIILKLLGVAAIFLPLFLIYYQQRSEIKKEKKLSLNKAAMEITKSLIYLESNDVDSSQYQIALSSLRTEFAPQFKIYGNDSIATTVKYLYLYKKASTIMREYDGWYSDIKEDLKEIINTFSINNLSFNKDTLGYVLKRWKKDSTRLNEICKKIRNHNINMNEKINYEVSSVLNEMQALDSKIYSLYSNSFNQVIRHFYALLDLENVDKKMIRYTKNANNIFLIRDSILRPLGNIPGTVEYHHNVVRNMKIPLFDSLFNNSKLIFERQLEIAIK